MTQSLLTFPMARIDLERRSVEPIDGPPERLTSLEARVLAFLAANTDRVVTRDELLTEVWGYAPTTVSRACDSTIRRLRTKIEPNPSEPECLLTVHGTGYRLVLGRPDDPLPPSLPPVPRLLLGLDDRTIDLDRARVDGAGGSVALTANELAVIEILWAAAGRSVDRETLLRRIWGSAAGRPLDHAVSRLRRKLEVDPARPRVLVTTTTGYRLELGGPADVTPGPNRPIGSLPGEVDRWVGREEELERVLARVDGGDRLLVLVGPGGVGKSRLAAAAARRLAERRGCGGWWFDLTGVDRADGFYAVLARELQVPTVADEPADQVVRAVAALGPAVVVLDNLDELAGTDDLPISRLLESAPEVTILGTTRILLRVQGERRLEVGPLDAADAEALFADRAIRPPDPSEQADVAALMTELEGMPLAIELAAAATRVLSVAEIRRRTRDDRLAAGDRNRPERYRSLRSSLDGSWELASPWARSALAQLSVFRGGFTIDAAEHVLLLPDEVEWTVDVVEELVDASLVRLEPDGSRFAMLQVVVRYAAERLEPDLRADLEARHGAYYASLGTPEALAASHGPTEVELRRGLKFELDNLTVACDRAIARGDAAVGSATACAVWTVLELTGPIRTGADLLARVAAMPGAEPRVTTAAGAAFQRMGALDTAEAYYVRAMNDDPYALVGLAEVVAIRDHRPNGALSEPALAIALERGDRVLECLARLELGMDHRRSGRNDEALQSFETALRVARTLGARRLSAMAELRLAVMEKALGSLVQARARLTSALASAIDVGARALEATAIGDLGAIAERAGGLTEGAALLKTALEIQRDIGDRPGEARALSNLARTCSVGGQHDEAEQYFHEALELTRRIGMFELGVATLGNWANLANRRRRPAEAERRLQEARALARDHQFDRGEALSSANLGNLYASTGRLPEALEAYTVALEIQRRVGHLPGLGGTLGNMGVAVGELGDPVRARALLLEALQIHQQTGDVRLQAGWHQSLALLAIRAGDVAEATAHVVEALRGHWQFDDRTNVGRTLLVRAEIEHAVGDLGAARATLAEAETVLGPGVDAERVAVVRKLVG